MTRVFVNGKQVAKEELSNYEITNENAKRMIVEMLSRRNKTLSK